jgi:hypothetical protein
MPGRKLQAHHRPGVKERMATFAKTRALRKRPELARRIKTKSPADLTAVERGIAYRRDRKGREILRPVRERREGIRQYIAQQIEQQVETQVEAGFVPLEEFDLDLLTTSAHLGKVHAHEHGKK